MQYGTCVSTPSCIGGSEWTGKFSQVLMAGDLAGLQIVATDSIHLVTEEQPSCHLPHIHGNPVDNANPGSGNTPPLCPDPTGCMLEITTVTELDYESDPFDTGSVPIAATELKTKLKSRQAIWEAAGIAHVNFTESDATLLEGGKQDNCGMINQASIDWAISKLGAKTRSRFEKYGQRLVIGLDQSTCIAGPCWINSALVFDVDDEANNVVIQSTWMGTENANTYPCGESKAIPCDAGFHYCKVLSPARAIEWMYVDGLRNKLGLKNL
jgi:hypothetical protein